MKYTKGLIKSLQGYVVGKGIERGFKDQTNQERLLFLTEELGELIKACRKALNTHTDITRKDGDVGEEIADILIELLWAAHGLGIDVEEEFIKKEAKNNKRVWKRN